MSGAYERGYAAGLKAAADSIKGLGTTYISIPYAADQILSLPIQGEATNPGEQVVRDAHTEDGSKHCVEPARPGPSQECVSVPFSIAYHLESMSLEMGGKCHICSQFRSLLAAAKEE